MGVIKYMSNRVVTNYLGEEQKITPYHREILPKVWVDFYDVADAYNIQDSAMEHALKKILAIGKRGHKDAAIDRAEIAKSVARSNEKFKQKMEKK